jgi:hypothetical protein
LSCWLRILKDDMPWLNHDRILEEAAALEDLRKGGVLKTVGKVLLWVDLVPICFLYMALRAGSMLIPWWAGVEGVAGIVLFLAGSRRRSLALDKLGLASRPGSAPEVEFEAEQKPRTS